MNKAKKTIAAVLAGVMVIAMATGCGSSGGNTATTTAAPTETTASGLGVETVKIGVFEPITGANAAGGALEVEGIELANELRPEVLGVPVELVVADNKSDKVEAANAASRLVESENVAAIIGSWGSSFSIAAGDIVKAGETPAVGASCTNALVTAGNEYYFRVCFIDPYQGKVMANYAFNDLSAKTAAIIREVGNDYSIGLAQSFETEFKALTGDDKAIVATVDYQTGDQDLNAQVLSVSQAKPDVIFAPGNYTESALAVKQAREMGITTPFLGGDTWETPEFIEVGGAAVEGVVFSTFFDSNATLTPETEVFVNAYKEKHNGAEPAAVTALSYDAYNLILDAIEACGSVDGPTLRQAIEDTKDFPGAAGYVNFDENGDATKNAVIKTVKEGAFSYLTTVGA